MSTTNDFARRRPNGWVERRRELRKVWERAEAVRSTEIQDDSKKDAPVNTDD